MINYINISQTKKLVFVMIDSGGTEVAGLGTAFTVQISKNGGAFAASAGTKTEISNGWYTYTLTATETNTLGPLAVKITHASTAQQNLIFQVVGADWTEASAVVSLAQLKAYLGITEATDDDLLTALLARADQAVETYCSRKFTWTGDATTRYFTVGKDTVGRVLYFDEDCCAISSIITDADNADGGDTLTANTDYITLPRNITPYHAVKLLGSSDYSWTYSDDPEMGIEVTGKWSYSETPDYDIAQATIRLAGYYYKLKDAQVFDTTVVPDAGIMMIPKGIPADVKMLLDPYRKIV